MAGYLPFIQSDNNYTLRTTLGDTTYELDVRWNSRDSAWYMDIYTADRTPIVTGVKLVLGTTIGRHLQYLQFFQDNILQVLDTTNSRVDASFDDLGGRIQVIHMTMDEFKHG